MLTQRSVLSRVSSPLSPIFSTPPPHCMPYAQLPGLLKSSLWLQHLLDFACILHYITLHCNIIMYFFLPLETHSLTFQPGKPVSPTPPSRLDWGPAPVQAALSPQGWLSSCLVNWLCLHLSPRAVGPAGEHLSYPSRGWCWARHQRPHSHTQSVSQCAPACNVAQTAICPPGGQGPRA